MAAPDLNGLINLPGELVFSPSGALDTGTFPFNGTRLGTMTNLRLEPNMSVVDIMDGDAGQSLANQLWVGDDWTVFATLENFDDDAINLLFPNVKVANSNSDKPVITYPSTNKTGRLLSNDAVILLFSPTDVDRLPGFVIRKAIPQITTTAALHYSSVLDRNWKFECVFRAMPDSSGNYAEVALLKDITL